MNVFIDLDYDEQIAELRQYFRSLGADISEDKSPLGLEDDLLQIVNVCGACFNHGTELEIESVLNGIVSLLVTTPSDNNNRLIFTFSDKLAKAKLGNTALKVLWLLFQRVDEKSPSDMTYIIILF
ncbi:hypothetical protein GE061_007898, partial [Apolygus lucorum]